jgi:hypothetical protein
MMMDSLEWKEKYQDKGINTNITLLGGKSSHNNIKTWHGTPSSAPSLLNQHGLTYSSWSGLKNESCLNF